MNMTDNAPVEFMPRETALAAVRVLAHTAPTDWWDYSNLASAFFILGHDDEALDFARRAVRLARNPHTLLNLAVVLETRGMFHAAFPLSEEAHHLNPADSLVACHYSDALLRMGRLSEAWPLYSATHTQWSWVRRLWPEWDGFSSLRGKRLLVLSGGGYGDNILFLRWMPRLREAGAHVTFLCPPSLHTLVAHLPYINRLIAGSVAGLEGTLLPRNYDLFTCILSLGGYYAPTLDDIPFALSSYLRADPTQSALRRMVLRSGATPLLGICTRAGEEKYPRRHRSLTAAQTTRILSTPVPTGADWVNLNYDLPLPSTLQPSLRDWSDTAAVIANLDLVVTVDTGVAHLSGALGIPTFVLLPGLSAAYYGVHGDTDPFYFSHRLFRNHGEGIDRSVDDACAALSSWRPA